jgi:hypothetical protein
MTRPVRFALLVALLALPLVLQGASLPHTHFGAPDGFFNLEHDLTLRAISATVASLDVAAPGLVLVLVVTAAAISAWRPPGPTLARTADSRAPPAH